MTGDHVPEPVSFNRDLRARLEANLGRHDRLELQLDGRRHAAVAVVVLDSDRARHGDDPHPATEQDMAILPGGSGTNLSGSVAGTAGGAAVLLTRRSSAMRAHAVSCTKSWDSNWVPRA